MAKAGNYHRSLSTEANRLIRMKQEKYDHYADNGESRERSNSFFDFLWKKHENEISEHSLEKHY